MAEEEQKRGITLRRFGIGAVKPEEDSPKGYIWVQGQVENTMNLPMSGIVAVIATQEEKSVRGQQRVLAGGLVRSIFNPAAKRADFNFEIPVDDIGPVNSIWNSKIMTSNLLGRLNQVESREGPIRVLSLKAQPVIIVERREDVYTQGGSL